MREFEDADTASMEGLFINLRRPLFRDARVREALQLAYDFEWSNRVFQGGEERRITSFFFRSRYQAPPLPDAEEKALLEPFRDSLPPELFTTPFKLHESDASGYDREALLKARRLLEEAGWRVKEGILTGKDEQGGERAFRFEILLYSERSMRLVLPYVQNLRRLGIIAQVRLLDSAQYIRKREHYEYDMVMGNSAFFRQLGDDQYIFWHSDNKNLEGGYNLSGMDHPAVDRMTEIIMNSRDDHQVVVAARALDRVLQWQRCVIPFGASFIRRIAFSADLCQPHPIGSEPFIDLYSWWKKPSAAAEEDAR